MSRELNMTNSDKHKPALLVIAHPATSTTIGISVGFWGAELTHAYRELTEVGYQVTVARPESGTCELDAWSDPRDPGTYSRSDLIPMDFINTSAL